MIREPAYTIVAARPEHLSYLNAIELAAARLLAGHAPESVLNEITTDEDFEDARQRNLLWVALADEAPVGFAHVKVLEPGVAHLDEIDVHPAHGRRGLGSRLVRAVCTWAWAAGFRSVTLCTFREVPWNMPFYARLGFQIVRPDLVSPALRAVVLDEMRRGLDPARRVVMRRRCPVAAAPTAAM